MEISNFGPFLQILADFGPILSKIGHFWEPRILYGITWRRSIYKMGISGRYSVPKLPGTVRCSLVLDFGRVPGNRPLNCSRKSMYEVV